MKILAAGLLFAFSTYPPPFPREGATKVLENESVVIWDVTWENGKPTPMHQHPVERATQPQAHHVPLHVLAFRVDRPADVEHSRGQVAQRQGEVRLEVGRQAPSARSQLQQRPGETYQLWAQSGGRYFSLGTFEPDESGFARYERVIPEGLANYDTVVVTIERGSGSPVREGPTVFFVSSLNLGSN